MLKVKSSLIMLGNEAFCHLTQNGEDKSKFHSQKKIVNRKSKIVIQCALAIAVVSFFEVKRKKRFSEKRGPKGNAKIIKVKQ